MVALWFGALFGLGSVAIRASLLESVITGLGIDAIFTFAAPPIGATTRILLALAMAAIGGFIGADLARRIAKPKKVVVPRRRDAGSISGKGKVKRQRSITKRPEEVAEEQPAERAYMVETAPLPGGAPEILNVSAFELEGFEPEGGAAQLNENEADIVSERDIGNADHGSAQQASWAEPLPGPEPELDTGSDDDTVYGQAGPDDRRVDASTGPFSVPMETPEPEIGGQDAAGPADGPFAKPGTEPLVDQDPGADADALAAQPDADTPFDDAANLPRFAAKEGDNPFVGDAKTPSVFDPIEAPSLFPQPQTAHDAEGAVHMDAALENASSSTAAPAAKDADQGEAPAVSASPSAEDARTVTPGTSAAQRITSAKPEDLSQIELLERLALSIHKKRHSRPVAAQTAPTQTTAEEGSGTVQVQRPATPENKTASETNAGFEAAPAAQPFEPDAAHSKQSSEPNGFPVPPQPENFGPAASTVPAALRPVDLGMDDDDLPPNFSPPRHVGISRVAQPDQTVALDTSEKDAALESGYSSLLDLSRSAPTAERHVRIEEPEDFSGEIEPSVVFPGQSIGAGAPFSPPAKPQADPPVATNVSDGTNRAEQPTSADGLHKNAPSHGADGLAPFAAPADRNPEETERALRSALATLQRMSGAA